MNNQMSRRIDLTIEVLDRRVELMAAAAGCSTTSCSTSSTTFVPVIIEADE